MLARANRRQRLAPEQLHFTELGDARDLELCSLQFRRVPLLPLGHPREMPRRLALLNNRNDEKHNDSDKPNLKTK